MKLLFEHTVSRKEVELQDKKLIYRCLECESVDRPKTYSLLITLTDEEGITDERFIYDITEDKETAEKIFCILTENTVTPFGLEYALDSVYDVLADE